MWLKRYEKKQKTFESIKEQAQIFLDLMKQHRLRALILTSSFELANLMHEQARGKNLRVITHSAGKSDKAIKSFISDRQGDVLITRG